MGLARDLSMGPRRPRSRVGFTGDFALLRRMTKQLRPDLAWMREVLDRVGASPTRLRFAEGVAYVEACERYSALTGERYGPVVGQY